MTIKTTLKAENLQNLGAEKLAVILMDLVKGNALAKRNLRWHLFAAAGPETLARELTKRLATLAKNRAYIEWDQGKPLASELESLRNMIAHDLSKAAPSLALRLHWQFVGLIQPTLGRADDSHGRIYQVFSNAIGDMGQTLDRMGPGFDEQDFANQYLAQFREDQYGLVGKVLTQAAPHFSRTGLDYLVKIILAERADISDKLAKEVVKSTRMARFSSTSFYDQRLRANLEEIYNLQGDVDAFITLQGVRTEDHLETVLAVHERLIKAGRLDEAETRLKTFEAQASDPEDKKDLGSLKWDEAWIALFEAQGHEAAAQTRRWQAFKAHFNLEVLHDFIKRLPDFDDEEKTEEALDYVAKEARFHQAFDFLMRWPDLKRLAQLIEDQAHKLDGDAYWLYTPAAETLSPTQPLVATLLLRAMIDFSLKELRAKRYGHAAQHLKTCASLAIDVDSQSEGFKDFPNHDNYYASLRSAYPRRQSFWSLTL